MSQPWSPEYRALRAARAELRRPKGGEKCRCGKPGLLEEEFDLNGRTIVIGKATPEEFRAKGDELLVLSLGNANAKPANIVCTCGCGAAACRQCIREGRIG